MQIYIRDKELVLLIEPRVFNGFAVPETTLTDGNHISLQCVCGWRVWLTCVVGHSMTCLNALIFWDNMAYLGKWRSRRDSNPRDGSPPAPLAGVCLRPLGHSSTGGFICAVAVRQVQNQIKATFFINFARIYAPMSNSAQNRVNIGYWILDIGYW